MKVKLEESARRFWIQVQGNVIIVIVCLFSGQGCSCDECKPGSERCSGNAIMYCQSGGQVPFFGASYWERTESCPSENFCVDPYTAPPFCALSEYPDPRCELKREYCNRDVLTLCSHGFVIERRDCAEAQSTCVTVGDAGSLCALSESPDTRCQDGIMEIHKKCEDKTRLECAMGYAISAEECKNACLFFRSEFESDVSGTLCAISSESDERCTDDLLETGSVIFCKDNALAVCKSGYAQTFRSCEAQNATCYEVDGSAQCVSKTK
ncbi:MAG: hypothetical protein JXA30_09655 [Deltaproteobacteria bacterium]|nr:hypothetical protein [Deltaproteobacteria bacterium]